jgi:hypothetical protein
VSSAGGWGGGLFGLERAGREIVFLLFVWFWHGVEWVDRRGMSVRGALLSMKLVDTAEKVLLFPLVQLGPNELIRHARDTLR